MANLNDELTRLCNWINSSWGLVHRQGRVAMFQRGSAECKKHRDELISRINALVQGAYDEGYDDANGCGETCPACGSSLAESCVSGEAGVEAVEGGGS